MSKNGKPKHRRVKNTIVLNGQRIPLQPRENTMRKTPQRPLNTAFNDQFGRDGSLPSAPSRQRLDATSPLHPRNGAPKKTAEAQPVPGMKRQTNPSHDFLHGAPIDDEPNTPKTYESKIPVHPGMTDKQKAAVDSVLNSPNVILSDAANLGRKPEKA